MAWNKSVICRTGERAYSYEQYLQTAHWKALRSECISACGGICMSCKRKRRPLNIHHKHYNTLGNETRHDVIPLCEECHKKEHASIDESKRVGGDILAEHKRRKKNDVYSQFGSDIHGSVGYHDGDNLVTLCKITGKKRGRAHENTLITETEGDITCQNCKRKLKKLRERSQSIKLTTNKKWKILD